MFRHNKPLPDGSDIIFTCRSWDMRLGSEEPGESHSTKICQKKIKRKSSDLCSLGNSTDKTIRTLFFKWKKTIDMTDTLFYVIPVTRALHQSNKQSGFPAFCWKPNGWRGTTAVDMDEGPKPVKCSSTKSGLPRELWCNKPCRQKMRGRECENLRPPPSRPSTGTARVPGAKYDPRASVRFFGKRGYLKRNDESGGGLFQGNLTESSTLRG